MEAETDDSTHRPPLNATKLIPDMTLHAQELDLTELDNLDSLLPNDLNTIQSHPIPGAEIDDDLDGILPSESFSTQVSPTTSLVDGAVPKKPPISLFQHTDSNNNNLNSIPDHDKTGLPSPPKSPDRRKDDSPTRCSDIEDSPPLQAAGFVGDEIPSVDPLDSDGEWALSPTLADLLPTKAAWKQRQEGQEMNVAEEKKKRKKKKKKSKGVLSVTIVGMGEADFGVGKRGEGVGVGEECWGSDYWI